MDHVLRPQSGHECHGNGYVRKTRIRKGVSKDQRHAVKWLRRMDVETEYPVVHPTVIIGGNNTILVMCQ